VDISSVQCTNHYFRYTAANMFFLNSMRAPVCLFYVLLCKKMYFFLRETQFDFVLRTTNFSLV